MEDFEPVVEAFASRAQIIRMDFRGRGASDHADPATYHVPFEARDVLALLDHLGLPKVTILGTSRGGLVAMVLAAMAKARLSGVILNDIGPVIARRPVGDHGLYRKAAGIPDAGRGGGRLCPRSTRGFANVPADLGRVRPPPLPGGGRPAAPALRPAPARGGGAGVCDPSAVAPDLWPLFDALAGCRSA
jgi:pimeloyl-ACP methyl ester carboxylesterase